MHHRVVHFSLNPPPALWDSVDEPSGAGYKKLRSAAYVAAREAGVECGAAVFHRVRCADKDDPEETDGPHWHVVGFGWLKQGRVGVANVSGWVVRNHGVRLRRSGVVGTLKYVLSHSHRAEAPAGGISQEGKSAGLTLSVTWFGRQIAVADLPEEGRFCPLCGVSTPKRDWTSVEWRGKGPPPRIPCLVDWAEVQPLGASWRFK